MKIFILPILALLLTAKARADARPCAVNGMDGRWGNNFGVIGVTNAVTR